MTKNESHTPIALLRELLSLDCASGTLRWRAREPRHFKASATRSAEHICNNWNSTYAGTPALAFVDVFGHLCGRINARLVYAHRAVFAMTHGYWPMHSIDHINGDPGDNRPTNLRDVPHIENQRNMKRSAANTSGVTGVNFYKRSGRWGASITVSGRWLHLGFFDDKEDAIRVRQQAERTHRFHANHGRAAA